MKYSSGISEALTADVGELIEVMRDAESSGDLLVTQGRWYPVGQEGGLAPSVSTGDAAHSHVPGKRLESWEELKYIWTNLSCSQVKLQCS